MPHRAARLVCALALAAGAAHGVSASDAVPAAAAGVPDGPVPPKVIVLRSGEVVEGAIRFAQGGYEVERRGGRMFLAESYAWITARSRRDAYDQLCARLPNGSADDHVAIARWCVTNRLYSCAQKELESALTIEPDHAEARATLLKLDALLQTATRSPAAGPKGQKPMSDGGLRADDSGGSRPELTQEFVAKIQPLLVNRCGNAACHGTASSGSFRLLNVRLGNPAYRRKTDANLKSVLGQVSPADPAASPLVTAPRQPGHGGSRQPVFNGPSGEEQRQLLARWVRRAASTGLTDDGDSAPAEPSIVLTGATEVSPTEDAVRPAVADVDAEEDEAPLATAPVGDSASDLLRRTIADERPDAFDPEEFNRRFGPQAGRPSSSPSEGPTP